MTHLRINLKTISVNLGPGVLGVLCASDSGNGTLYEPHAPRAMQPMASKHWYQQSIIQTIS